MQSMWELYIYISSKVFLSRGQKIFSASKVDFDRPITRTAKIYYFQKKKEAKPPYIGERPSSPLPLNPIVLAHPPPFLAPPRPCRPRLPPLPHTPPPQLQTPLHRRGCPTSLLPLNPIVPPRLDQATWPQKFCFFVLLWGQICPSLSQIWSRDD